MKPASAPSALQAVLAGEHAAVYVYGALGGRLVALGADTTTLRTTYAVHQGRRDHSSDRLVALKATPAASAPAYTLPGPVETLAQVEAVAALVESRCQSLYAQAVEACTGEDRGWAFDQLAASAVQALGFGAAPEALPTY